ncbi:LUD domain-containing protein [Halorutilales archaeon Cl-col2-1]
MSDTEKAEYINRILEDEGDAVYGNTHHFNESRDAAVDGLGDRYEDLRSEAREIKEDAIERLPSLIEELRETVESNGGTVYVADDAEDARRYVAEVSEDADADTAVKSKSMTTEEIDLNDALEEENVDVYETDLGEFVIQLADEEPSHIIGPGIHKSRQKIARLFNDKFDLDHDLETAEELTEFASDYLGDRIDNADVGITGANFVSAESGTVAVVTNEGNARKVVESTRTHVAVAGIEKILPSVAEMKPFIELIGRSGTGQAITSYVSLLTPPLDSPVFGEDADAEDREFHLVLVDNGRSEMRQDEVLRETLYCIRCSACLNTCPNFQSAGGHVFGGETYTGGIATGWEAGVEGLDSAEEFNDLCTGCSRCVNKCPVKIDIPWINTAVRDRINRGDDSEFDFVYEGLLPADDSETTPRLRKLLFGNFERIARIGSKTAPVSNLLAESRPAKYLLDRVGVDSRRDLPEFESTTLRDWFESRAPKSSETHETVVLYPDVYTNYINVERGKAAVRVLESLGVEVVVPDLPGTGRAPLSQGMVETARLKAERLHDSLTESNHDPDVVVVEPSSLAMLRSDYEKLLPEDEYAEISARSYELFEYIEDIIDSDPSLRNCLVRRSGDVFYHSHCQQRTLGLEEPTVEVLEAAGYDVTTSDAECCGMAGSFGYKSEYYDLSVDVGEKIQKPEDADHVVASGSSCEDQMNDLLSPNPETRHPVRLLDPKHVT